MATHGVRRTVSRYLRSKRAQAGFSLVELLVAMAILSIGLLGLAALQVSTSKQGTTARERGTATLVAHNLLDRIQAEGAIAAAERDRFAKVAADNAFVFIAPDDLATAHDSTAAENLILDIRGRTKAVFDIENALLPAIEQETWTPVFTVSWRRQNGTTAGARSAFQEFIVNVAWQEVQASGTALDKYLSVSRNVRL
jgi:type IV pilus modification protein PilV